MSFALEVELLLVAIIGRDDRHGKGSLSATTWLKPANLVRPSLVLAIARNALLSLAAFTGRYLLHEAIER